MTKVIPIDLYNDSNILNNYGHLYIKLEGLNLHDLLVNEVEDNEQFTIHTAKLSGNTYLTNIKLYNHTGEEILLFRPLNSRDKYSLYFEDEDDDYTVFTHRGELTTNFLSKIGYDFD